MWQMMASSFSGFDVGYRRHVVEVPVVRDHTFDDGVVEGDVGMMSDFVKAVHQWWPGCGTIGLLSVADGSTDIE